MLLFSLGMAEGLGWENGEALSLKRLSVRHRICSPYFQLTPPFQPVLMPSKPLGWYTARGSLLDAQLIITPSLLATVNLERVLQGEHCVCSPTAVPCVWSDVSCLELLFQTRVNYLPMLATKPCVIQNINLKYPRSQTLPADAVYAL